MYFMLLCAHLAFGCDEARGHIRMARTQGCFDITQRGPGTDNGKNNLKPSV